MNDFNQNTHENHQGNAVSNRPGQGLREIKEILINRRTGQMGYALLSARVLRHPTVPGPIDYAPAQQ